METETRKCKTCERDLPISEFYPRRTRGPGAVLSACRSCKSAQAASRYKAGAITRRFGVQQCAQCHRDYTPTGPGQRFCSVACRWAATPGRVYVCEKCGKSYTPSHKPQRFCSIECKRNAGMGRRIKNDDGYVLVRVPRGTPGTQAGRTWILEHRYVMQQSLGRPLGKHETVHHKNGDKTDNRLENLQLRQGKHGKHVAYRCLECGSQNVEPMEL